MGRERETYRNGTTPNVCIVGAGVSGLLAGIKLKGELGLTSFTIFDENDDVGGIWLKNTFPGSGCDVKSHLSSFSFEPNSHWGQNYVQQEEVLDYLRLLARKYSLYPYIKFNCQVKSLIWNATINKWNTTVISKDSKKQEDLAFDVVISATGIFREPIIPDDFKAFKGPIIHTASWDPTVDLEDKVVGVVGSGVSAIQLIPAIVSKAKSLHCYQRNPAWVLPRIQFHFPILLKWFFAKFQLLLLILRWVLFWENELYFPVFIHNSWFNQIARNYGEDHLKTQIPKNVRLRWELLPKYTIGCKPIIFSNEYYPAMGSGHVTLHTDAIVRVKDSSLVTSLNGTQKLDVLILATGFKEQEFFGPMTITDKRSQNLLTCWKSSRVRIRSYYGLTTSATPNLFFLLGPNTRVAHTSVTFILECQMTYIVLLLKEMMQREARVIEVREFAEDEFLTELEQQMRRTVWKREKCSSWFTNSLGAVTTVWPWSSIKFWRKTRVPIFSHYQFYS